MSVQFIVRDGADESLARPTSRCRGTESIVSLERGVCSCAELQSFLVTEAERKHVRRGVRFQHRDASCNQGFFLQGKAQKEIHAIPNRNIRIISTIVCHSHKLGAPSLNVIIFPPVMRLVLDDPKRVTSGQIHELILEDRRISAKSIAE